MFRHHKVFDACDLCLYLHNLVSWTFNAVVNVGKARSKYRVHHRFWFRNWLILPVTISVLATGVTALCTISIFQIANQRRIREQSRSMVNLQNERGDAFKYKKSAVTVLYLYGLMLVLYLPLITVSAAEAFHGYTTSLKIGWDYATIGFISSSVNPVSHFWRTKQVRRAIIEYLRKTTHGNNSAVAAESVQ